MKTNGKHEFEQHDLLYAVADKNNPLPRSILRRTAFELLDGEWRFALDVEDKGLKEKWFARHEYERAAQFPGSIESHLVAAQDVKELSSLYTVSDEVVAWYERDFTVPADWLNAPKRLVQLTFGACGYETRVWLNGNQLTTIEGEAVHFGEYNSFSYELPSELLLPVNRLTVRVADTINADIPRGKQASRVYKQGGIWYQSISGAVRSVWLETVGRNRLRSRLGVVSNLRDRLVELDLTLRIHEAGAYRLRLTATPVVGRTAETPDDEASVSAFETDKASFADDAKSAANDETSAANDKPSLSVDKSSLSNDASSPANDESGTTKDNVDLKNDAADSVKDNDDSIKDNVDSSKDSVDSSKEGAAAREAVTAEFDLVLEAGEKIQRVPLEMPDARFWTPDAPNLYHLWAELIAPDGGVTGIETNFGLRKISARARHVYLNNEPIYIDGILYQPGVSTFDEIRRHMLAIKRLGCNLARVHIAGIDPRIYDLADDIGLMLWVEIPSPHSSTQQSRDNHWAELQRTLVFIASHPSIVVLSLYNEDWGAEDIETNVETRRYISNTFDYLRLYYPQLLVVDNDGWNHVSRRGKLCSHLLTAHVYTPDAAAWASALDRLVAGQIEGVTAQPLITGDAYFYRGQAPLLISEWGGFGFTNYGGPGANDEKSERIREFKREMRRRPVAGDIYTQATSIEDETNGIIDAATGELLVPAGLLGKDEG